MTHYEILDFVTHSTDVFFTIIMFNTDYFSTQQYNIDIYNGGGCVLCEMEITLLSII